MSECECVRPYVRGSRRTTCLISNSNSTLGRWVGEWVREAEGECKVKGMCVLVFVCIHLLSYLFSSRHELTSREGPYPL